MPKVLWYVELNHLRHNHLLRATSSANGLGNRRTKVKCLGTSRKSLTLAGETSPERVGVGKFRTQSRHFSKIAASRLRMQVAVYQTARNPRRSRSSPPV